MRKTVRSALGVLVCLFAWHDVAAAAEPPIMDRNKPLACRHDAQNRRWRLQCDDVAKVCLFAPDSQLDALGKWVGKLKRVRACGFVSETFDRDQLKAAGYRLVPAIADVPYGWLRDERGRVFQVNFDLHRRMYVGGRYSPSRRNGVTEVGRAGIDFGVLVWESFSRGESPTRHRLRLVEGQVNLAPFSADIQLLHYDISRRQKNPLLRITTFFGKARRGDLKMNLGFWLNAGGLEIIPVQRTPMVETNERLFRFVTGHVTADIWQSPDLYSYVRVRGGVGVEGAFPEGQPRRVAFVPGGAAEASFALDQRGFNNLNASLVYDNLRFADQDPVVGSSAYRMSAKVEYEAIFMALNDQPLSLVVAATAQKRTDVPGLSSDMAFAGTLGLRFSLWAPSRRRPAR